MRRTKAEVQAALDKAIADNKSLMEEGQRVLEECGRQRRLASKLEEKAQGLKVDLEYERYALERYVGCVWGLQAAIAIANGQPPEVFPSGPAHRQRQEQAFGDDTDTVDDGWGLT